jgi:tight adherence protein C
MITDISPALIAFLAFGAVTAIVFVIGQFVATQARVQHRAAATVRSSGATPAPAFTQNLDGLIASYFDEKRFGIAGSVRAKLRRELVRAAFFNPNAINYYVFFRVALVAILPSAAYILGEIFIAHQPWFAKLGIVAVAMMVAVLGPDAYLARRQRRMHEKYRLDFPDLLDLMVVCIDAGLSLEAALDRITPQVLVQNRPFGTNLMLLGAEIRTGRSLVDALDSLADRLGLDEARSFVGMLRQSIELGSDVGEALRVFSDEMRDRRLLRAEERANQLPVKMVGPLGLFIFPVILMTVMLPVILRLISIMVK